MPTPRELLLAKSGRTKTVTIETPVGPAVLELRAMSFATRQRLVKESTEDGELRTEKFAAPLITACLFDPSTGQPCFTLGDRDAIGEMDAKDVDELLTMLFELNGLTATAAGDAEKN